MSLARIRDEFHVPARLGQRVKLYTPEGPVQGSITGSRDDLVTVWLDWDAQFYAHPRQLVYLKS